MEAVTQELALRYLLELSPDIRVAMLLGDDGGLIAAAPEDPGDRGARAAGALVQEALALAAASGALQIEIDVTLGGGAAFLVREGGPTLLCVTGPFALPGLILHDMRVVLDDLRRGAPEVPAG
jgi:hypothetical protein